MGDRKFAKKGRIMGNKIEKFEDLDCWRSARELVKIAIACCQREQLRRDFEIRGQLKRAALSAMNNIAEGFGRFGDRERIQFLNISQSSSIEVKSMTYVLEDADYLDQDEIALLRRKAEETKSLTLGFIRYLKNRGH